MCVAFDETKCDKSLCQTVKRDVHLCLTGSYRNANKDDDRADLLWQPESAANPSSQEGSS